MTTLSRPRLGKRQTQTLMEIASPGLAMLAPSRADLRLVLHGLTREADGAMCITPAGLEWLAAEMRAGRIEDALARLARLRAGG